MPFAYRLDKDIKIFFLVTYGHCTFSDIFSPSLDPETKPENRPRVKFIVDNLLGDLEVDMEGMKFFIRAMNELKSTGFQLEPTAFITNKRGLEIFIKSLDLLVDNDVTTHMACSSLGEALIWLDEVENAQAIQRIRDELLETLRLQYGDHPQLV
ncbi:MAG: hypothetical protein U0V18_06395 [Anaerolineales bacterium]